MIHKNKKGAGADLLLEVLLSSIIFFVVVVVLYAIQVPQQEFKAHATVISADGALACETSLTNLLRANSPDGPSYEEWLSNGYMEQNKDQLTNWTGNVSQIFNRTFSADMWNLIVTLPNSTVYINLSEITKGSDLEKFGCTAYAPLPVVYMKAFCFWSDTKENKQNGDAVDFKTPDGDVSCKLALSPGDPSAEPVGGEVGLGYDKTHCNLDYKQSSKSLFQDDLPTSVENTPDFLDSLILPILVNGKVPYEITVQETEDGVKANVTLAKRTLIQDCALHVTLTTTNVSSK
jgi:hypothetical protein